RWDGPEEWPCDRIVVAEAGCRPASCRATSASAAGDRRATAGVPASAEHAGDAQIRRLEREPWRIPARYLSFQRLDANSASAARERLNRNFPDGSVGRSSTRRTSTWALPPRYCRVVRRR